MITQKLMDRALEGVDALGYRLDQMGITSRINRHNIAAFLMTEQKHLEGEWDSLQVRLNLHRCRFESITREFENRANALAGPVISRVGRLRPGVS